MSIFSIVSCLFFLIFNIPNLLIFFYLGDITSFLLSIYFLLVLFLYKNCYVKIFFTINFLLYPFYILYIYIYKRMPDENILMVLLESNFKEIYSYAGDYIISKIVGYILYVSLVIYFFSSIYKNIVVSKKIKTTITIGFIFLVISLSFLNKDFKDENYKDDFEIYKPNISFSLLKKTFPLNFYISVNDLFFQEYFIKKQVNKSFIFNVIDKEKNHKNKNIILVIGESSRRNNWGLNNYSRNTNPLLMGRKNIVNFDNMLSISNITRSSIPMMLTRKKEKDVDRFYFNESSVISLFNQVGYETSWLSMQQQYGFFENTTSIYSKEAMNTFFLNNANYDVKGNFDYGVIGKLKYLIEKNKKNKLIVIHMLGSHQKYSDRYPDNYNYYRPSLTDLNVYEPRNPKYKNESINSYDNSILYTDYVLNEIIETLAKDKSSESFLLFSSDHGEDLFDNECNNIGHGSATVYNYEIASFAWYSDSYEISNFEKISWLKSNKHRKINQTSIFPTLVDAANLEIPNDSLDKSILKDFKEYPRLVAGGVDFDKAQFKGICKEIQ